jgi:hypothetical protein
MDWSPAKESGKVSRRMSRTNRSAYYVPPSRKVMLWDSSLRLHRVFIESAF